jgi:hypothetical protein
MSCATAVGNFEDVALVAGFDDDADYAFDVFVAVSAAVAAVEHPKTNNTAICCLIEYKNEICL